MSAKSNVERISLDSVNETSVRCALIAVAILLLTVFPVAAQDLAIGLHPLERNVAPPTLTERVRVTYTPEAKGAEVTGWIDLQVHVRSDGTVGDVEIVTSCLDASAVSASRTVIRSNAVRPMTMNESVRPTG